MSLQRPCLDCGELSDRSRCAEHRPPEPPKASAHKRGYDFTWFNLSRRARKMQPFCSDCGTTEDLTTDHSEEAWRRKEAGLVIRLEDVDVLCRSCNAKRGRARPTGVGALQPTEDPLGKTESAIHCEPFSIRRGA